MSVVRKAFQHTQFARDAFDVEFWDDQTTPTEIWTAKAKQAETWTPVAAQPETWLPKEVED